LSAKTTSTANVIASVPDSTVAPPAGVVRAGGDGRLDQVADA